MHFLQRCPCPAHPGGTAPCLHSPCSLLSTSPKLRHRPAQKATRGSTQPLSAMAAGTPVAVPNLALASYYSALEWFRLKFAALTCVAVPGDRAHLPHLRLCLSVSAISCPGSRCAVACWPRCSSTRIALVCAGAGCGALPRLPLAGRNGLRLPPAQPTLPTPCPSQAKPCPLPCAGSPQWLPPVRC